MKNSDLLETHVLPIGPGHNYVRPDRLRCFRCKRDLPADCFKPQRVIERRAVILDGVCKTCREQMRIAFGSHPLVTPAVYRVLHLAVNRARAAAPKRGIVCSITAEDVLEAWVKQGGKCAVTGVKMECQTTGRIKARRAPSIDRKDSGANYTTDNIWLVCWAVNAMKSDMTLDELRFWARLIAEPVST